MSRRGLLGVGVGLALSGCLRAGSDAPTATGDRRNSPTAGGTATPESELQSTPAGLAETWSRERDPLAVRAPQSDRSVFVAAENGVRKVEPSDGSVRWDRETERIATRPTVTDSTVYASGRDGTVYALARDDGTERWTYEADTGLTTVPIALPEEDRVVVGAGESEGMNVGDIDEDSEFDPTYVYGLDTDGNEAWTVETEKGNPVTGTAVHDGVVYVRTVNRLDTYDLAGGTERDAGFGVQDVQWDNDDPMSGTYYTSRVAADETGVYLLTQDSVAAVGHDGAKQWTFEPFDSPLRFQYESGTVYISAADNALYAVDAADGSRTWRVQVDATPKALLLAEGYLWCIDAANTITAVDTGPGTVAFSESVDDPFNGNAVSTDLAVVGRRLVYTANGTARGFEIKT